MVILWFLKNVTNYSNTANKATKLSTVTKPAMNQESADFSFADFERSEQPFFVKKKKKLNFFFPVKNCCCRFNLT